MQVHETDLTTTGEIGTHEEVPGFTNLAASPPAPRGRAIADGNSRVCPDA